MSPRTGKKYVFFVSHSTKDLKSDIGEVCDIFKTCNIQSYVADRDAPIGKPLPEEIKRAIRGSELVLAFLTKNSRSSPWVNQEIGFALGKGIPVIPLKKGNIRVKGLIESTKYVKMRDNPLKTVQEIFTKLDTVHLSLTAEAAVGGFVAALSMIDKYGASRK